MRYSHIFFDMDGTLLDSDQGTVNSVKYALAAMGFDLALPPFNGVLPTLTGPLHETYKQLCGLDDAGAAAAVQKHREYFATTGLYEAAPYPGVPEMLMDLHRRGHTLFIATSKAQIFAERILRHLGLAHYFTYISGAELSGERRHKSESILHILQNSPVPEPSKAIMAGDTAFDVQGAHQTGLPCAAVLYGYGTRAELEAAKADFIVETVGELHALLRG